ncbi:GPD1 [Lepeophtheirus salmonis]|uniref:Glycerol-3-phosphate dehydrogenase [NAD(+)] n=1 Tax=Lepeophtheirus salmonis TaxID=72036 RepID=A0A7R8CPV3_LEPSM|nr:GPD1 [Lepeophtheirus salmonis]CAF2889680.1 GPD1 [Lepeophtheirus salmonis]
MILEETNYVLLQASVFSIFSLGKEDLTFLKSLTYQSTTRKYIFIGMSKMAKKICIVGSGNWGSAIARIVGANVKANPNLFHPDVKMWVMEEIIHGEKLTHIINTKHENVRYLPGKKNSRQRYCCSRYSGCSSGCRLLNHCRATPVYLFLLFAIEREAQTRYGGIKLISKIVNELLDIPMSVLMGANIANEVASEMFCETTIGCSDSDEKSKMFLKKLFCTPNFRVTVVDDTTTVELCGALKNIVACGAGFVDGLQLGDNTKAAVIRLGLMEMIRFTEIFFSNKNSSMSTFLESCGIADLITTCYGGRNRRVSEAFVKTNKPLIELEKRNAWRAKASRTRNCCRGKFHVETEGHGR